MFEGCSMKKVFLCVFVNFKYISLSFNFCCLYFVIKIVKLYNGIDYVVCIGILVVLLGNGKVIKVGYSKYNGNYVFISYGI